MALADIAMGKQKTAQPQQSETGQSGTGHYNGTVQYQGKPVIVKDSIAEVGGERFIVSDDGRIVVNDQRQFVGTIQNGKFMPVTPELIEQFKQEGVFENEQSQNAAAQAAQ